MPPSPRKCPPGTELDITRTKCVPVGEVPTGIQCQPGYKWDPYTQSCLDTNQQPQPTDEAAKCQSQGGVWYKTLYFTNPPKWPVCLTPSQAAQRRAEDNAYLADQEKLKAGYQWCKSQGGRDPLEGIAGTSGYNDMCIIGCKMYDTRTRQVTSKWSGYLMDDPQCKVQKTAQCPSGMVLDQISGQCSSAQRAVAAYANLCRQSGFSWEGSRCFNPSTGEQVAPSALAQMGKVQPAMRQAGVASCRQQRKEVSDKIRSQLANPATRKQGTQMCQKIGGKVVKRGSNTFLCQCPTSQQPQGTTNVQGQLIQAKNILQTSPGVTATPGIMTSMRKITPSMIY